MSILITGGAGFIGSSLADRLLENGEKIIVIDNFYPNYDKEKNVLPHIKNQYYKLYRADICDKESIQKIFKAEKIDAVVHLAASVNIRNSFNNPAEYVKNNIEGTLNILEIMKTDNIKKLVFASSSSVYGNSDKNILSESNQNCSPISVYGVTKLACEKLLYEYSKNFNINVVALRFFTVYGPKQRPDLVIRKFYSMIKNNEPVSIYGDGTTFRDYTYIDDIIDGIIAALNYNKTPYEIINLGSGRQTSLNDMIKILENAMGKNVQKEYLPPQRGDIEKTLADISKAQDLLNYTPKISLETGIMNFVQWADKNI